MKVIPRWSENLAERKLWFYIEHVQKGRPIHHLAAELGIARSELQSWAGVVGLPPDDTSLKLLGNRPSRELVFMEVAKVLATRSTCLSCKVGCVIAVNNSIVATGFNGAPQGFYHCTAVGVCRKELMGIEHNDESIPDQLGAGYEASRAVHAEANAICQAARRGASIDEGVFYVTRKPCVLCHRMLVNCGTIKGYYLEESEIVPINLLDAPL